MYLISEIVYDQFSPSSPRMSALLSVVCLITSLFPVNGTVSGIQCGSISIFWMNASKRLNQMRVGMFPLDSATCYLLVSFMRNLKGALRVGVRAEQCGVPRGKRLEKTTVL